jgi:hypothetical protein
VWGRDVAESCLIKRYSSGFTKNQKSNDYYCCNKVQNGSETKMREILVLFEIFLFGAAVKK